MHCQVGAGCFNNGEDSKMTFEGSLFTSFEVNCIFGAVGLLTKTRQSLYHFGFRINLKKTIKIVNWLFLTTFTVSFSLGTNCYLKLD
jgi:hypothetical protein